MSLNVGIVILRAVIGLLFAAHAMQKLTGWFGGPGLRGFAGMLEQNGLRHTRAWALVVALAELSGLLLAVGLLTPLVAAALVADMLVAILLVHGRHGFWNHKGGFEFNLVLLTVAAVAGLTGGGRYALDRFFGDTFADWAPAIFLVALVLGLVVFAAEYLTSRRAPLSRAPSPA
jgi:putative oxidoreductase